jgi:hypothetical protein
MRVVKRLPSLAIGADSEEVKVQTQKKWAAEVQAPVLFYGGRRADLRPIHRILPAEGAITVREVGSACRCRRGELPRPREAPERTTYAEPDRHRSG